MPKNFQKIIIAVVFVFIAGIVYNKLSRKAAPPDNSEAAGMAQPAPAPESTPLTVDSQQGGPAVQPLQPDPTTLDNTPKAVVRPMMSVQSKAVIEDFQNQAHLEFPKEFQDMEFQKISGLGSDTVGVIGKSELDGTTLATISRPGTMDLKNIKDFLQDDVAEALKMNITADALEHPENVGPPAGSGFSSIKVWTVKDGDTIAIITAATRSDNGGYYLNIFSGSKEDVEKNEDHYDEAISKFKTK